MARLAEVERSALRVLIEDCSCSGSQDPGCSADVLRYRVAVIRILVFSLLLLAVSPACANGVRSSNDGAGVTVRQLPGSVTISNGFVELSFDLVQDRITHLSADHTGRGQFNLELLAPEGITFGVTGGRTRATVQVVEESPQSASLRLGWASPGGEFTQVTLSLKARERGVQVRAELPPSESGQGIRVMLQQWFLVGIFERGVVQYIAGQGQSFSSTNPLRLFYTMDRANGSVALEPDSGEKIDEVSLLSSVKANESGILLRPAIAPAGLDVWKSGSAVPGTSGASGGRFSAAFTLYADDLPYPAHREDSRVDGMDPRQVRDLTAYFEATYGSAAGVLGSYAEPGSAYPTLAHPVRPYGDRFNFFDPDTWEVVTTLAYSGDPLLESEARKILKRSESAQRSDGQIPHHFESGAPTYLSIAGSSQTGPNIFWTLAATEYAAATGDEAWLRAHYAHLRMATDWLLARYDPQEQLIRADGPLFIDVFRRSGYTLDTNVFAVYLLDRMSQIATYCGDASTANRYRELRESIRTGIVNRLWDGDDHFVTERHADGSTRDFVDYDGNFGALAFGILQDDADAHKLLLRLDSGPHVHPGGYGTWVSERRYEKQDCYKENDGDSDVAMARIWWLDMAARVQMNDRGTFDSLFEKMEDNLLENVWMPERFDAQGMPAHNSYYHEYPEVLSMVLREMRYGVHVGMEDVSIRPFDAQSFSLHLGGLRVDYSAQEVTVEAPGSGEREFSISGLVPGKHYLLSTGEQIAADSQGMVRFHAPAGKLLMVSLEQ